MAEASSAALHYIQAIILVQRSLRPAGRLPFKLPAMFFFVFFPRCVGKRFVDFVAALYFGSYHGRVRSEGAQAVKCNTKILGLLNVRILTPSTEMFRSNLYSFVPFVKMVAVDLVRKSIRFPAEKTRERSER